MDRQLEAIALAVAHADPGIIPEQILRAYAGGATVAQVLAAVDVGCCLAEVPPLVAQGAWHATHAWAWMARRRDTHQLPAARNQAMRHSPAAGSATPSV